MFMHRIGTLLVTTADNVIISMFIGVVALGEYSNYSTIMVAMTGVLKLIFSSLTSVFGHLYVEKDKKTAQFFCEQFHFLNFAIGMVFFLGYYAVIDNLIAILFAEELVAARAMALAVTVNGFVQFLRTNVITFREATGTFYHDRWKPIAEGVVNIILSIFMVKWIGVVGVIVATVITNLLICHVVEPFVLYKYAFATLPKRYYLKNYVMILIFGCALLLMQVCTCHFDSQWTELLVNGCISIGISLMICLIMALCNKGTAGWIKAVMKRGKHETPDILAPIQQLKTQNLGNHNPRLHTDEVLIALAVSAAKSELAKRAMDAIPSLRYSEVHSTVILSQVDTDTFRKLGVNLTVEPKYQTKKLFHN